MSYEKIRDLPLLTAEQESTADRDSLILHNARLAASRSSRWSGRGVSDEDLEQEAMVGLIKAANKFDPSKGTRFSTHATPWIDNQLRRAVQKGQQVRLPIYLQQEAREGTVRPTFKVAGTSGDEGMLDPEDRNSLSPEEGAELNRWREHLRGRLHLLSPRETSVLTGCYGLDGERPLTVTEMAEEHGVSRGMISKIKKRAEDKIRG